MSWQTSENEIKKRKKNNKKSHLMIGLRRELIEGPVGPR